MRPPKNTIFICYRRNDSADVVGRIYDRLTEEFGAEAVFRDVDGIPRGVDFRDHIETSLQSCRVGLIMIGPDWLGPTAGSSRLAEADDRVRIECETLLNSPGVTTIPCYVRGAAEPKQDLLPSSLSRLPFLNGLAVRRDPDFRNDIEVLKRDLHRVLQSTPSAPGTISEVPGDTGNNAQPAEPSPPKSSFSASLRRGSLGCSIAIAFVFLVVVPFAFWQTRAPEPLLGSTSTPMPTPARVSQQDRDAEMEALRERQALAARRATAAMELDRMAALAREREAAELAVKMAAEARLAAAIDEVAKLAATERAAKAIADAEAERVAAHKTTDNDKTTASSARGSRPVRPMNAKDATTRMRSFFLPPPGPKTGSKPTPK